MKKCTKCNEAKPRAEFSKNKTTRDGLSVWCKVCSATAQKKCPSRSFEKQRVKHFRRKYNISAADYEDLLCMCDACCMICGIPAREHKQTFGKFLCVDHDHQTGKVRGILCDRCNAVLGKMQDDPDLLVKAAAYLTDRS